MKTIEVIITQAELATLQPKEIKIPARPKHIENDDGQAAFLHPDFAVVSKHLDYITSRAAKGGVFVPFSILPLTKPDGTGFFTVRAYREEPVDKFIAARTDGVLGILGWVRNFFVPKWQQVVRTYKAVKVLGPFGCIVNLRREARLRNLSKGWAVALHVDEEKISVEVRERNEHLGCYNSHEYMRAPAA